MIQHHIQVIARRSGRLQRFAPTVRYLTRTEVHAFAFAIAASVLLSVFPFLHLMASLFYYTFKWPAALKALQAVVADYFGPYLGPLLKSYLLFPIEVRPLSILLLLFTANGVFEPLEVALNRAWGVTRDRSFVKNQLLSFLLIILCGMLVLGSLMLTTANLDYLKNIGVDVPQWMTLLIFRTIAVPMIVLALFLTYWLLPNCSVPKRRILPVAFWVGIALTALQYTAAFLWKWTAEKLTSDYGPFSHSSTLILFSFIAALVVLAGAEWSARREAQPEEPADKEIMVAASPAYDAPACENTGADVKPIE